jgi:uncharacterized protein (DUF362 family)
MNRRSFIKESTLYGSALFLGCRNKDDGKSHIPLQKTGGKSRVVITKDETIREKNGKILSDKTLKNLDKVILKLTNSEDILSAWKKIFKPEERISIKVNCLAGKGMSTSRELVDAVIYRLQEMGVRNENIIVWERLNADFERADYPVITDKNKVRFLGNDLLGFTSDFYFFGEVGSLLSRVITDFSDAIINIPVLKDHGIVGASIGMKNMFGAIHNPNKYHLNTGDPYVADVSAIPVIKDKMRLIICDALNVQYEGGPPYQPQHAMECNTLLAGFDPVAVDLTGWKMIEEKRKEKNLPSLKEAGREPVYIYTAADENHKLGNAKEEMIDIINC